MKKTLVSLFWIATVPLFGVERIHFVTDVQPNPVVVGEPARFTVFADANIQDPYPFGSFETADGANGIQLGLSGLSQESRNINGEETNLTMWTFNLVVSSEGTFTIPETEATIDGKTFKVPATTFTAKENPKPKTPAPTTPKKPALSPIDTKFILGGSFPNRWYVGQCCPATVQLLIGSSVRGQLTSYPQKDGDKFSASQLSSDPQKNTVHRDGRAYAALEWPTVLTALQSGTGSLSFAVNMELERPMIPKDDYIRNVNGGRQP